MKKESRGMMIAEKRKELGMTQRELAEKMGVTDKAVSKWERALSYPDLPSLAKLAETLGMSVDELLQMKSESMQIEEKTPISKTISRIPGAICLAMGVAVVVLSVLGEMDNDSAIILSGIGVACAGISLLDRN